MMLSRYLDVIANLLLVTLAGTVVVHAHAKLVERDRGTQTLISSIQTGSDTYAILSKQRCVGKFDISFSQGQESWESTLHGEVQVRANQQVKKIQLEGNAFFNSLGQLGGSFFNIKAPNLNFTIGTSNINPISLRASFTSDAETLSQHATFPGPIRLIPNGDGSYRLNYDHFDLSRTKQFSTMAQPMLNLLNLSLSSDPETACPKGEFAELDLQPLLQTINRVLPKQQ